MASLFRVAWRKRILCRVLAGGGSKQSEDNPGFWGDPFGSGERGFGTAPKVSMEKLTVGLGETASFQKKVLEGIDVANETFAIPLLKQIFENDVRSLFVPKCLIIPQPLDKSLIPLHRKTKHLFKHKPLYLSSLDVMTEKGILLEDEWSLFLEHLFSYRVLVVEDWTTSYGSIQALVHSSDSESSRDSFKGECDASFDEITGKAKLAFVIFKDGNIVWVEVFHQVPCKDIVEAEILSAIALLFKLIELKLLRETIWIDSKACYGVLNGEHNIQVDDPNRSLFLFLRSLRVQFESLVPIWKPRELLLIPDMVIRLGDEPLVGNADMVMQTLEKLSPYLTGTPRFRIRWTSNVTKIFGKKKVPDESSDPDEFNELNESNVPEESEEPEESTYWLEADGHKAKLAAFLEVMKTLSADRLLLVIDRLKEKPDYFQNEIADIYGKFFSVEMWTDKSVTSIVCKPLTTDSCLKKRKKLAVIFDAAIPLDQYLHQEEFFTLVLAQPNQVQQLKDAGIKEINAESLVNYNDVQLPPMGPKKQKAGKEENLEKRKKQKAGKEKNLEKRGKAVEKGKGR